MYPDNKGAHAYPYVHYMWAYDVDDLAAVKAGTKQMWDVMPYAHWELPSMGAVEDEWSATGIAFDPAANLLYVLKFAKLTVRRGPKSMFSASMSPVRVLRRRRRQVRRA